MRICFELTMPNRGSWNGGWSGEGNLYAKVVNFANSKAGNARANKILEHPSYYHAWGDGWGASIKVRKVDGKESASIKRRSKGFCGYTWMIDNILDHGTCYEKKPEPIETKPAITTVV